MLKNNLANYKNYNYNKNHVYNIFSAYKYASRKFLENRAENSHMKVLPGGRRREN
jgi:hypothetical protein